MRRAHPGMGCGGSSSSMGLLSRWCEAHGDLPLARVHPRSMVPSRLEARRHSRWAPRSRTTGVAPASCRHRAIHRAQHPDTRVPPPRRSTLDVRRWTFGPEGRDRAAGRGRRAAGSGAGCSCRGATPECACDAGWNPALQQRSCTRRCTCPLPVRDPVQGRATGCRLRRRIQVPERRSRRRHLAVTAAADH
jgi:hypothetical protein